jgi:hypothetical protein
MQALAIPTGTAFFLGVNILLGMLGGYLNDKEAWLFSYFIPSSKEGTVDDERFGTVIDFIPFINFALVAYLDRYLYGMSWPMSALFAAAGTWGGKGIYDWAIAEGPLGRYFGEDRRFTHQSVVF